MSTKKATYGSSITRVLIVSLFIGLTAVITASATPGGSFAFLDSVREFLGIVGSNVSVLDEPPAVVGDDKSPGESNLAFTGTNLLTEDFSFSGLLTSNGWTAHSAGGTTPLTTTTGLTYSGYPGSGTGNAVLVGNLGGEDDNRGLSADQTGNGTSVYVSFLANVNDAAAAKAGDYIFHIGDRVSGTNFTSFAGRVYARVVASNVNFGINNANAAAYGTTNFAKNTTYLLVIKYTINTGGSDTASLWVIPSGVPTTEAGAGTAESTSVSTGQDVIDAVGIRQGSATQPQTILDGIRIGTTWEAATSVARNVTFNSNGGSAVASQSVINNTTATQPTNPTKAGFVFGGWYSDAGLTTAFSFATAITADITLFAKWDAPPTFTVTYDANGGTSAQMDPNSPYNSGSTVTVLGPGGIGRTGYSFNGWNTAADGSGTAFAQGNTFNIGGNITFYAQWTINQYSVSYAANGNTGGTAPATQNANFGSSITLSGAGSLVKTGYTFNGWNAAADGSGTSYAGGASFTIPASNTILYAQWTPNQYSVFYNGNGNTGGTAPATQTADYGNSITLSGAGTLIKTGYSFTGWNTAADGSGTGYAGGASFTIPASDTTLYAQWTVDTYTVTYSNNGGTGAQTDPNSPYNSGSTVTVLGTGTIARTGYTFANWNTAANGSGTTYNPSDTFTISANTILYAQWTINTYTVSYNANGGTGTQSDPNSPYNFGTTVTVLGTGTIARIGYTFANWNTAANGSGTSYNPSDTFTISLNTILYAQWTINQYTVTYSNNGGTGSQTDPSSPYTHGSTVTVLGTGSITRASYTFANWNTAADGSGTSYNPAATFTILANTTLYAQWTIDTFTVTYSNNGGTGSQSDPNSPYNFGTTVTVLGTGTIARIGYTFANWNTAANGSGTSYNPSDTFTIPANTTLYAQWTINQYSLFYNGNGNTGGTAAATQTADFGTSVTVSGAGSLVKTGYTFSGWNTAADGTGTTYPAGASFTIPAQNTTLYAQWTINQYTVNYSNNGGTGSQTDPNSPYNFGATVTVLGTGSIARTGYTFANWNTAANGGGTTYSPAATFTIGAANVVLYAQWTIDTYTITATAGSSGSISPSGAVSVNHGDNQTFTITPNAGYHVDTLTVDGGSVPAATSYTFTNVTAAHTIAVTFAINTYTITATAGANGSISPSSAVSVNHGANQSFTITPNAGYHVDVLTVDGGPVAPATSYTFTNVTATHTIDATFAANPTPVITFDAAPTPTYLGGDFTVNATTTNTDSPALTYSVVSGPCVPVSGATFSSTGAGTCVVQANGAATANYTAATATQNVTIAKANQATVTLSGVPGTATYGDTFTAVGGGGSGTGAFSYAVTGTACTVHPSTGAGSVVAVSGGCSVTATRAGDTNYNPATSAASVIATINPAEQATLTAVATPSTVVYGNTSALSSTGGSGTGAVTFSHGASTGCAVAGNTLSVTDAGGTCAVTATKAADANYNQAASAPLTVTLQKADQATLTVDDPGTVTYGSTPTLATSGGSGTGAVTFSDGGSAGCSVTSGGVLTVTDAGAACNVTATKATDNNYNPTTSAERTITLAKANQAALTAVATPSSVTYGSTSSLSSTGGSGTGAVTFSSGGSTGCSVLAATLSVTDASGTCAVSAIKAADNNYNAATSAPLTVTMVKAAPTVTFGAAPTPTYLGGNFTVSASTTNTDSSALTYSVVSGPCAPVSGATFSSTGAGTCQVQASGAATSNFTAASATQNVTIAKATPTVIFGAAPTPAYPGADFTVSASTTNTDSSTLIYSKVSGPCTFAGGATFSSTGAGTCIVRADGAASANFNAAFDTQNVTIAAAQYTINASAGPNGSITPGGAVLVTSGANQAFTISADAGYHIADVLVDGVSQGATGSYTFTNVTANHTISATFAINTYTIAAAAGANGSISPSGSVVVNHGANQSFTITPDGGYNVANVLVDGVSVGAVTSHTFTNVTANHTIAATFFSGTQAPIVYVDDDWAGTTLGTDPDGAGPASSFGYDAFATIQDGVAGVAVNGTVIVNPGSYSGDVNVNRAIDVRGVFTISGALTVTAAGASVSPGFSPGIVNSGNLSLTAGSNVNIEVNGPIVGTQYDQLNVTGTVSLGNANLNTAVSNLYTPSAGQTFTIVNNDGNDPVTGTFAGLAENDVFYSGTTSFRISYAGGSNNNDVVLTTVALCSSVSIPNYTTLNGSPVTASVNVDDTTGKALQSTDFTITYNPAAVTFGSASLGTVTAGGVLNMNSSTPGTLVVSIFKATPFSGAGSMLDITFNAVGQPGTSTALAFNAFKFNEGTQCISTANGSVSVISGTITGTVTYGNSLPAATRHVPNTTIDAVGSVNASVLTNLAGAYSIGSLGAGSYTVTPSKSGEVNGAVSGMDAAQIAMWVVGTTTLNTTQQTVADVSGTGGISSFDAALIARYVVSLPNAGSSGTWRFTPTGTTYPNVNVNRTGDYTALLMGDVSGNWIDPLATRPAPDTEELKPVVIAAPELSALVNTEVIVPVEISDTTNKGILAYQFELRYDPAVLDPAVNPADLADTISSGYQVTVNAAERGLLRVVVFGTQPLSGGGRLINLRFNAIGNPGSASDLIWENLGLNEGGFDIRSTNGRVLVTAAPSNNASIGGRVMTAEGQPVRNARVTLTDTTGQSRYVITGSLGYYQFTGLQTGQTYTVHASAKRHRFQAVTVSVSGEAVSLDIIAQPGG